MGTKRKASRRALVALVVAVGALLVPPSASAYFGEFSIAANAATGGVIDIFVYGDAGSDVAVGEEYGGKFHSIAAVTITPFGGNYLGHAARWRCDRRTRTFVASTRREDGSFATVSFDVRTPSCKTRLSLALQKRARPKRQVKLRVEDRWKVGKIHPRLCLTAPGAKRPRCSVLRFQRKKTALVKKLRFRKEGHWKVLVRTSHQRISRTLRVGKRLRPDSPRVPTVLLTGDSQMQTLDNILTDRIEPDLNTEAAVFPGTGLSKSEGPMLLRDARKLQKRLRPVATVVFLGINEGLEMRTPAGATVPCCGEAWTAEYTRRVTKLIRTYKRTVVYMTVPAPRDKKRLEPTAAVNEAIHRATAATKNGRLLDTANIFTPGFVYRSQMPYRGKIVKTGADDGFHLSVAGSKIAARAVVDYLRKLRVLPDSG